MAARLGGGSADELGGGLLELFFGLEELQEPGEELCGGGRGAWAAGWGVRARLGVGRGNGN